MAESRTAELGRRLRAVQNQIDDAARRGGRSAADIVLVVVTKTWPTSDIAILHDLGVRDVGENRHQDAEAKAAELSGLDLTWHFIGQVQSNKAARIAGYADVVHSVDSVKVATRLAAGARSASREVECFVQVSLDEESAAAGRGGVSPDRVGDIAAALHAAASVRLRGVMGVAPLGGDADAAYRRLAETGRRLRELYPAATGMSAGMSGDLAAAISAGATHVRVGSAVLGERPPLR